MDYRAIDMRVKVQPLISGANSSNALIPLRILINNRGYVDRLRLLFIINLLNKREQIILFSKEILKLSIILFYCYLSQFNKLLNLSTSLFIALLTKPVP